MITIENKSFLKKFGKEFHLTFDDKWHYCISNAYKNDIGEYIPSYFYYNGKVYGLKYFDGCFNPYLVHFDKEQFGFISESCIVDNTIKPFRIANEHHLNNCYKDVNFKLIGL